MTYLDLVFPRPEQFVLVAVVALMATGLTGLGRLVSRDASPSVQLVAGWGLSVLIFYTLGTLTPLSLRAVAGLLAVGGIGGFVLLVRDAMRDEDKSAAWAQIARVFILALPLILLVAAMRASQWDEFSHWLPNAHYLALHDHFPTLAARNTGSAWPAYPYGMPLINYTAGLVQGVFSTRAGLLFNLLLLIAAACAIGELIGGASSKARTALQKWGIAAASLLLAVPLNPSFVAKIAFTNYVDSATSCVMAISFAAAMRWLAAADENRPERYRLAIICGCCAVALVGMKQSNIVLFALLAGAVGMASLIERRRLAPSMLSAWLALPLPLAAAYLWQHYTAAQIPDGAMPFLAPAQWHWNEIGSAFFNMLDIARRKSGHFGVMLMVTVLAIVSLWRPALLNARARLAIRVTALVFLGYSAFLLFSYLVSFTASEASTAASFWRYSTHLGLMGMLAVTAIAVACWRVTSPWRERLCVAAIVVVLAIPFVMAQSFRVDLDDPHDGFARNIARAIGPMLPAGAHLALLDLYGDAGSLIAMRYEIIYRSVEGGTWAPPQVEVLKGKAAYAFAKAAPDGTYIWLNNGGSGIL